MNRVEFMTELAILLQNIPAEERREAMQYYNDYFDDAGIEKETEIIQELGSPKKIAEEVKAGLRNNDDEVHEYHDTGYSDTRFEKKETSTGYQFNADQNTENRKEKTFNVSDFFETNKGWKIALIILAAIVVIPIIVPILSGVVSAVFGILIVAFAIFLALIIASAAVAVSGIALVVAGLMTVISHLATGLVMTGSGIILTVLGVIATVASVRLCILVWPAMFKGIVRLCRKPFQGRKAVA